MFKFLSKQMFKERNIHRYDEYLIQMQDVVKAYETEAGEFLALKNVKVAIGEGEFVGVIGKSGSGKSTLINMISGIDRPTKGEVYIGGSPIHTCNEGEMAQRQAFPLGGSLVSSQGVHELNALSSDGLSQRENTSWARMRGFQDESPRG